MSVGLDFERPLAELRKRLEALDKQLAAQHTEEARVERDQVVGELEAKAGEIYSGLDRWQKVQVARHQQRPQTLDYARTVFTDFVELHGDRAYGDDPAVVGGPARLDGRVVMLVGNQRGRGTKESVERKFGSPHPEGYRKALRLFRLAEKFGMPLITFVDTPGASPGLEDEERGQAWALAGNIAAMAGLGVPILSAIIGEGNSGGALALCVTDRLVMLEHAVFSVASPEAVASILWRDSKFAPQTAESLKSTAQDLRDLDLIDRIVPEPPAGAHSDPATMAETLRSALLEELAEVEALPIEQLLASRYQKYRRIGTFHEG
ncbi:MAG: acetyl-CoA carboxylase carboxyltransferase subunit alpha [Chloroflexota bacterium]